MTQQPCRTVLLTDDPAKTDSFGSHRRVAKAIGNLLRQEEHGGRAIALEGAWGSGKSTTVHLLQEELEGDSQDARTELFLFDAWVHHGDPLKRAFLEELVDFCITRCKWIPADAQDCDGRIWSDRLAILSKSRQEVQRSDVPQIGDSALIILLVLTLLPVSWLLITTGMDLPGWFGIASRIVGIVAFAGFIWKIYSTYKHADDLEAWRDVIKVFVDRAARETQSIVLRTPEPTSIEFRSFFKELVGEALEGKNGRRLIVVIDNLDRIEADQALTIWATMRNFFDFGHTERPAWLDRFWLLVPFDRDYLERSWGRKMDPSSDGGRSDAADRASRIKEAGGAFLDKTFQVRFHVPSPVTSDRRKFFDSQFRAAFPMHDDEDERYAVYRIFDRTFAENGSLPTPRDIIVFLNEVGALHRQWPDAEIPLTMEALFVALRNKGELRDEAQLRETDAVKPQVEKLLGTRDWQRYLAALYFNIPPTRALQVLLTKPIEDALMDGDAAALAELAESVGFEELAPPILSNLIVGWLDAEPVMLAQAASAIEGLPDNTSRSLRARLWGQLVDALESVETLKVVESNEGEGLASVVGHASARAREYLSEEVLTALAKGYPTSTEGDQRVPDSKRLDGWADGVLSFVNTAGLSKQASIPRVLVPGDAKVFLAIQEALVRAGGNSSVRQLFGSPCVGDEIRAQLAEQIRSGHATEEMAYAVFSLPRICDGWAWATLPEVIAERLKASGVEPQEAAGLCVLLEKLYQDGATNDQTVDNVAKSQQFFTLLWDMNRASEARAVAACVLIEYLHNPRAQLAGGAGTSASGKKFFTAVRDKPGGNLPVVDQVAELLVDLDLCDTVLSSPQLKEQAPTLTLALADRVLRWDGQGRCVSPEVLLDNVVYVVEKIGEDGLIDILSKYPDTEEVLELASSQPVDDETALTHFNLYDAVPQRAEASGYQEYLVQQLNRNVIQWPDQLTNNGPLVRLVASLVSNDAAPELGQEFRKALEKHIKDLLTGQIDRDNALTSPVYVQALEKAARTTLTRNILERMCGPQGVKAWAGALELSGDVLADAEDDLTAMSDRIVRVVLCGIVESGEPAAFDWARKITEQVPGILRKAKQESVQALREELEHAITTMEGNEEKAAASEALKAILELIGPRS